MTDKIKLLHVEDDIDLLEITKLALRLTDEFDILQCATASEALLRAQEYIADILLLDVMMPEMSGDKLLAELRKLPGYQHTPAIFMTGRAYESDIATLKKAGGNAVIVKPFDPMTLADQIKVATGKVVPKMAILASSEGNPSIFNGVQS